LIGPLEELAVTFGANEEETSGLFFRLRLGHSQGKFTVALHFVQLILEVELVQLTFCRVYVTLYAIRTTGHETLGNRTLVILPLSVLVTVFFFCKTSDLCSGQWYKISVSTLVIGLGSGGGGAFPKVLADDATLGKLFHSLVILSKNSSALKSSLLITTSICSDY